jgi:selenocysteine lyase/cysteine desulfurase
VSIPIADAAERLQRAGIRASVRAGAVRVGFHLYNTADDLDRLVSALSPLDRLHKSQGGTRVGS